MGACSCWEAPTRPQSSSRTTASTSRGPELWRSCRRRRTSRLPETSSGPRKKARSHRGRPWKFTNNSFLCSCNASWLWRRKTAGGSVGVYEAAAVINSSLCVGPPPLDGLKMNEVEPVPANGTCRLMKTSKREARQKVLARLSGVLRSSQEPVRACGCWTALAVIVALAVSH
ncbi:hypothetical protein MTO96_023660 [Rhipicephalus appendiculatus]